MISITIRAETPGELAEAMRKLAGSDKLFVSASEVARAAKAADEQREAPRRDERKTIA